jgi:hypothetical protein
VAAPKPNVTLQAKLDFQDPDLTTPAHDDMLLWLMEKAQLLGERFFPLPQVGGLRDRAPSHPIARKNRS